MHNLFEIKGKKVTEGYLKNVFKKEFSNRVKSVFFGDEDSIDMEFITISEALDVLEKEFDCFELDIEEVDGWQADYTIAMETKNKDKFYLGGSGYYGGVTLYKREEL